MSNIPHKIGTVDKNPHILNGLTTISPRSLVDEFIKSIPYRILSFSSYVIMMVLSLEFSANFLYFFTVKTPSEIVQLVRKKYFGSVTLRK